MGISITEVDRKWIAQLREANVLLDINPIRFDAERGMVLAFCGDADQTPELLEYHGNFLKNRNPYPRIHQCGRNGGALRLAPSFPSSKPANIHDYLQDIREALIIKKMASLGLYIHAPCGKARLEGVAFLEQINLLAQAYRCAGQYLQTCFSTIGIASFCHIDYGNGDGKQRRRSYFVSMRQWEEWIEIHPHILRH